MRLVFVSDSFIPKSPWELLWLVQAHRPFFGSVKLAPIKYEKSFVPRHMKSDEGRFWKSTWPVKGTWKRPLAIQALASYAILMTQNAVEAQLLGGKICNNCLRH